jgi:CRP/FNR family nitrogen fixation transcriptional regulator
MPARLARRADGLVGILREDGMQAREIGKQGVERSARRGVRVDPAAHAGVLARSMLGVPMKFGAGTEIYGEGEPVEYVYEVVHGAVRTVKVLTDGRRTLGGFYFAGDIFGLEEGDEHSLTAEAIVDTAVRVIRRRTLIRIAGYDRDLARELFGATGREIARVHNHALMLIKTAQERVGSFLIEMADRISIGDLVVLPMSRQDIADYLGVTIETVSRTFTILEGTAAIALPNARAVVLRDRAALRQ